MTRVTSRIVKNPSNKGSVKSSSPPSTANNGDSAKPLIAAARSRGVEPGDKQVVVPAKEAIVRRTQTERRANAERRLLESAVGLLGTKGVTGMTLSEVGTAAGYSRGLVAHHYGSKENFLRAVAQFIRLRFQETRLQEEEPGLPALLTNMDLYLSGSRHTFAAVHAMTAEAVMCGGTLQRDMQNFTAMTQRFFASLVRQGIERGHIRSDVDPEAQAVMIVGLLRGISAQYLLQACPVKRDVMRREVRETVRRALAA